MADTDLTKSSKRMLGRKLQERPKSDIAWPLTSAELFSRIDNGPLPEIYNAIYFSIYQYASINQYGSTTT